MLQLCPGWTDLPHLLITAKFGVLRLMLEIEIVLLPELVSFTVCVELTVPTSSVANFTLDGDNATTVP
jgi:hypothetical protein